jgi:hypothetical protein
MLKLEMIRFKEGIRIGPTVYTSLTRTSEGKTVEMSVDEEVRVVTINHPSHPRTKFIPCQNVTEMDLVVDATEKKATKAK